MITNLIEYRRDGKVIRQGMTVADVAALGKPEQITEIRWQNESEEVIFRPAYSVLAKVVPGEKYVAVMERMSETDDTSPLWILNADGSRRLQIPNVQLIRGENKTGEFAWFEAARTPRPNVFGVTFGRKDESAMFQLDIDATDGRVLGVYPTR